MAIYTSTLSSGAGGNLQQQALEKANFGLCENKQMGQSFLNLPSDFFWIIKRHFPTLGVGTLTQFKDGHVFFLIEDGHVFE